MEKSLFKKSGTDIAHGWRRLAAEVVFWLAAILLTVHILGLQIWHGPESPFNTTQGKMAFVGIFTVFPAYIFARMSRLLGMVLILAGWILWTIGRSVLVDFVAGFARG